MYWEYWICPDFLHIAFILDIFNLSKYFSLPITVINANVQGNLRTQFLTWQSKYFG